jgi:predicted transcriptional regulator
LSAENSTQLEVAATLGVSDSLVSDYRRRIEQELRALSFGEIEEARRFEGALRDRVRQLVLASEQEGVAV